VVEKSESAAGLFGDAIKAAAHRTRTGTAGEVPVTGISHGHEADADAPAWPAHLLMEGNAIAAEASGLPLG
jgi:hypothetical protein